MSCFLNSANDALSYIYTVYMQEHLETACSEDLNELQGELEMLVDNQLSGDL